MKAGDTAYLVESNRFVHEVEILRCNGELYIDEVYPFVVESSCLQDKWIYWCTNLGL